MLTVVKILLQCVKIYTIYGGTLRTGESARVRFGSLYDAQVDEMSV